MSLMGIREYGRHRRVSHVAVLKALRTGRIRQNTDGLIDADKADRDWSRNTHPAPRAPRASRSTVTADPGFSLARTVRAHYEALLAKHEYEQRSAQLLNADEVKIASRRIYQEFRERMLRVPDAVVARLRSRIRDQGASPSEHDVYLILTEEIRMALEGFGVEMEAVVP